MNRVSIVIVCMNNLNNLFPCLDSILANKVVCDVWVVAYLFSSDNLKLLKDKYPWVIIVESNELRGFSENNNLALRQIDTEYTLVLNDDTKIDPLMISVLVNDLDQNKNITVVSPVLYYPDGKTQFCGRNPIDIIDFILEDCSICHREYRESTFINQEGLFQTYNVSGACFLVRQSIFREVGFFDERFFFCPEDIAFSTLLNKKGYQCWVDTSAKIVHYHGATRKSKVKMATLPAQKVGCLIYYGDNFLKKNVLRVIMLLFSSFKYFYFSINRNAIDKQAHFNCLKYLFSNKSTKDIFAECYNSIFFNR